MKNQSATPAAQTPTTGKHLAAQVFAAFPAIYSSAAAIIGFQSKYAPQAGADESAELAAMLDKRIARLADITTAHADVASFSGANGALRLTLNWRQAFSVEVTLYLKINLAIEYRAGRKGDTGAFILRLACEAEISTPGTSRDITHTLAMANLLSRVCELAATSEIGIAAESVLHFPAA
jgi:hypothetical protein